MSKKLVTALIIVILVLLLVLGGMIFGMVWFRNNHVFVDGQPYPKDAAMLNLRDREITTEHYDQLHTLLPQCDIFWNVPFQLAILDVLCHFPLGLTGVYASF